jgi:hypothetical protein
MWGSCRTWSPQPWKWSRFLEPGWSRCAAGPKSPPPAVAMLTDDGFVNTTRGSSLGSLEPEIITASPASFVRKVSKPPVALVVTATPLRRRARRLAMLAIAPQRSARLAKKALGRTPAVAATQNLLMKKLGLAKGPQHEMTDFDRYIQLFADGCPCPRFSSSESCSPTPCPAWRTRCWRLKWHSVDGLLGHRVALVS